jgi:class 3 adenylate cyclase
MRRRLAAILATDVVGYSRLMEADEEGTLTRLKALRREIVEPAIAEHNGRLVKLIGDGALVEFASALDATRCALAIQEGVTERTGSEPADRRIALRIGINVGDVIVEDEDIYGDGVNVAARLQGLADPGGICVSGLAYDHIHNKVAARFESLGGAALEKYCRACSRLSDRDCS